MHMDHTRLGDGGKGNCATPGLKHEHSADPHSRTKSDRIRDEVLDIALIFCSRLYPGFVGSEF